jgi:hypothetical protein
VLPFTVFLKLKDIGGNVLPSYQRSSSTCPWRRSRPRPTSAWPPR